MANCPRQSRRTLSDVARTLSAGRRQTKPLEHHHDPLRNPIPAVQEQPSPCLIMSGHAPLSSRSGLLRRTRRGRWSRIGR